MKPAYLVRSSIRSLTSWYSVTLMRSSSAYLYNDDLSSSKYASCNPLSGITLFSMAMRWGMVMRWYWGTLS